MCQIVQVSYDFFALEFGPEKAFDGKRLINHTIRTVEITVSRFCENLCYMEPDCVSINLYTRADGNGNYKCELNNATHEGHEGKLIDQEMYSYHAAEVNITFNLRFRLVYFVFLLKTLSLMFISNYELELFTLFQDSSNIVSVLFTKIASKTKHLKLLEKYRNKRTTMMTRITMTMLMTVVVDYWMIKMIIIMIMTITMTTVCFFCQRNCVQNPCQNNATCQSGFTKKGYRCLCTA